MPLKSSWIRDNLLLFKDSTQLWKWKLSLMLLGSLIICNFFTLERTIGLHWQRRGVMRATNIMILMLQKICCWHDFSWSISCYQMLTVPKQEGPVDCDLYAIAYAVYTSNLWERPTLINHTSFQPWTVETPFS